MWGSVSNYLTYLTRSPRKSVAAVDLFAGLGALAVLGGSPGAELPTVGSKVRLARTHAGLSALTFHLMSALLSLLIVANLLLPSYSHGSYWT
jgi:hypothetical protein